MSKTKDRLDPVHPGDVLLEDFMKPLGLSAYAVARAVGATTITISLICRRKRSISAEMALKLGRLFKISPGIWMGLQSQYDLELARQRSQKKIDKRVHPLDTLPVAA
jgi:addiction module HigA family antidote